jgi:hypothetical protein
VGEFFFTNELFQIGFKILIIGRIIQTKINHPVPPFYQPSGKRSHGCEKGRHLLNMVFYIVRLLADLYQHIGDVILLFLKPRMTVIQLIAQNES